MTTSHMIRDKIDGYLKAKMYKQRIDTWLVAIINVQRLKFCILLLIINSLSLGCMHCTALFSQIMIIYFIVPWLEIRMLFCLMVIGTVECRKSMDEILNTFKIRHTCTSCWFCSELNHTEIWSRSKEWYKNWYDCAFKAIVFGSCWIFIVIVTEVFTFSIVLFIII